MSKNGTRAIVACVFIWIFASTFIIPGTLDANTMMILEAIKVECYLTIGLGVVIILITLLDRGGRDVASNVDKAINLLKMYKLDGCKDSDNLSDAIRCIMRERAEKSAEERKAQRLADRKGSMKNNNSRSL